jgi:hypothetical protein
MYRFIDIFIVSPESVEIAKGLHEQGNALFFRNIQLAEGKNEWY